MTSIMMTGLASCWSFNMLPYTVWPSVAGLTKPSKLPLTQSIPRLSLSGFSTVHAVLLHCADCPLYSLVITQQVMCCDDLSSCLTLSSIPLCPLFVLQPLRLLNPSPQGWAPPGSEPDNPWLSHGMTSPLITQLLASSLPTCLPYRDVTHNVIPLVIPLVMVLLIL